MTLDALLRLSPADRTALIQGMGPAEKLDYLRMCAEKLHECALSMSDIGHQLQERAMLNDGPSKKSTDDLMARLSIPTPSTGEPNAQK